MPKPSLADGINQYDSSVTKAVCCLPALARTDDAIATRQPCGRGPALFASVAEGIGIEFARIPAGTLNLKRQQCHGLCQLDRPWYGQGMNSDRTLYRGYRHPGRIISHSVWLYHRFALSFRNVEEILRSISSINARFPRSLEYPPVVRQPSTSLRRDIVRNPSLWSREMVRRRRRFGTDSDGQAERCRGAPMRSAPVVWVGWEAVDQNQPACGGAREGGNREGAARASLVSRWVTGVVQRCTGYGPKDGIFLITAGSSMQAMIRSAPPQAGQVSMSMPKTRFSRCAHVIAMDGMYAGFAGAKTGHCCSAFRWRFLLSLLEGFGFGSLPPLPWCHRGAISTVGGKYAIITGQIDPGLRHQGSEPGDEVERARLS